MNPKELHVVFASHGNGFRICDDKRMGFPLIRLVINGNDAFSLEDAENYIRRHSAGWNLSSSFQPDQSDFKGPGLEKGSYYL